VSTINPLRFENLVEERPCHVALHQAVAVGREGFRNPHLVVDSEPDEPAEEQVVIQLLHQQFFTPDRVEDLQEQRPQEPLGRDTRPAAARVHFVEARRELLQSLVDQRLDRAQRVIPRHATLKTHVAEQHRLLRFDSAHSRLLSLKLPQFTALTSLMKVDGDLLEPC
jgi:hypothetical protein